MTFNLQMPSTKESLKPTITVFGVGGAGGNAVNNMINASLEGASFVMANTDAQALDSAMTERVIQLGANITQGLGAGSHPDVGRAAAEEAADEIMSHIDGSNMVFITAGMGGGTGTGAAPVIARMAREQGILTVAVVTKPFHFEGTHRMKLAEAGLEELQKYVDTMIVIPNQNLFRVANEKTTFADAFRMADEVLHSGVRGVTDLMVMPGLINLDFADIRTVMREMGKAMMGTGEAEGERRAVDAAEAAISNPLLDDVSMKGARGVLINITGGYDMTLFEVDEAANRIRDEVDTDANIIFGSTFNESMEGKMRVSVVATGIDQQAFKRPQETSSESLRSYMPRKTGSSAPAKTEARSTAPVASVPKSQFSRQQPTTQNSGAFAKTSIFTTLKSAATSHSATAEPKGTLQEVASQNIRQQGAIRPHPPHAQAPTPAETLLEEEYEQELAAQGALFEEAAKEAAVSLSTSRSAGIRSTGDPRSAPVSPASQRRVHMADTDAPEETDEEQEDSGFIRRMASRFSHPAEEPTSPRSVEVKTSRTVLHEEDDYLEIPAFLRRQAN